VCRDSIMSSETTLNEMMLNEAMLKTTDTISDTNE
jgi:hypothetical protein